MFTFWLPLATKTMLLVYVILQGWEAIQDRKWNVLASNLIAAGFVCWALAATLLR